MNLNGLKEGFAAVGDLAYEPMAAWAPAEVKAVERKLGVKVPEGLIDLVSQGLPRGFSQPNYDAAFKFLSVCAGFQKAGDMLDDREEMASWGAVPFANAGSQAVFCLKVNDAPIQIHGKPIRLEGLGAGAVFVSPIEDTASFRVASRDLTSFVDGLAATLKFYAARREELKDAADSDDPDEEVKPLVKQLATEVGKTAPDFVECWVAIHYPSGDSR